ncbi:substrate-binding domain-containing protein [Streptomyces sp.]|uniref:substrate-binding domain-containing protein n=1 Tax=Streptomyces sp. TaxID=1931 RepID=UPI002F3EE296
MRASARTRVTATTAVCLAVGLGACGGAVGYADGGGSGDRDGEIKIGLLLPENETARYERFDRPLIERKVKELCPDCRVDYANALGDPWLQRQQVDSMISRGVEVLVLDSVNVRSLRSAVVEAKKENIPVLSYDRLTEGPVAGFVGHRDGEVGRLEGEALLAALGPDAADATVVVLEGPSTRGWTGERQAAAFSVLQGKVKATRTYATAQWDAADADAQMRGAIAALGVGHVDGVLAANDVLAAGAVAALKADHIEPLPPVVAQDAELPAVQRVVKGEQYMSVYKPVKPEADTAAEMAVALGRGEKLTSMATDRVSNDTSKGIPAVLFTPVPVTRATIKDTVGKDGTYTIGQICTPKLRSACEKAGLLGPAGRDRVPPGT